MNRLIFGLIAGLLTISISHADECVDTFDDQTIQTFFSNPINLPKDSKNRAYLVSQNQSTFEAIEETWTFSKTLNHWIRIVRRGNWKGKPPENILPIKKNPNGFHYEMLKEDTEFAVEQFKRRNWPADFLESRKDATEANLQNTVHISVWDQSRKKRIGVIQFVGQTHRRMRYRKDQPKQSILDRPSFPEKLPEEAYLGIKLPKRYTHLPIRNEKEEIIGFTDRSLNWEVRLYSLEPTVSADQRISFLNEIWIQMTNIALNTRDLELSVIGQSFHTYADKTSLALYSPLGFQPLKEYEFNGKKLSFKDDEVPPTIEKDGIQWWPIVFQIEDLIALNNRLSSFSFRGMNLGKIVGRKIEQEQNQPSVEQLYEPSVLFKYLESTDPRIAEAGLNGIRQILALGRVHIKSMATAVPGIDYDSAIGTDPFWFAYDTYSRSISASFKLQDKIKYVLVPDLIRLISKPQTQSLTHRLVEICSEITEPIFETTISLEYRPIITQFLVNVLTRTQNEDTRLLAKVSLQHIIEMSEKMRALETRSEPQFPNAKPETLKKLPMEFNPRSRLIYPKSYNHSLSDSIQAMAKDFVRRIHDRDYRAIVLSGASAVVSYNLLKLTWNREFPSKPLPQIYWIPKELSKILYAKWSTAPDQTFTHQLFQTYFPELLAMKDQRFLFLDDHASTGRKQLRYSLTFMAAGFSRMDHGIFAAHPSATFNTQFGGELLIGSNKPHIASTLRTLALLKTIDPVEFREEFQVFINQVYDKKVSQ